MWPFALQNTAFQKVKHGILQAKRYAFAHTEIKIKKFLKNSSLVTFGCNLLIDKALMCDEFVF